MTDQPLEVFRRRCREFVSRCATGELTRPAAADRMQQVAEALGIVELIGQDRAQGEIVGALDASCPPWPEPARAAWQELVSSADVLLGKTFAPLTFFLPGLIPAEGVTLLASKPKAGKSWLALDLCIGATADRYVLGDRKPAQGDVLYLALEDSDRRLQRRLRKLLPSGRPARLRYATRWRRIDEGGLEDLRAWCRSVEKPRLIVVDVLARIRPASKGNRPLYEVDYAALVGLHALAIEGGVAILVVHHTRKMAADDAMDAVSGSFGLVGAVDTILVLERRGHGTVLDVRGRDVESAELAVQFGKDTCRWTIMGQAAEVAQSAERGRVLEVLEAGPLTRRQILDAGGARTNNALGCILYKMVNVGQIERGEDGKYALPGHRTQGGTQTRTQTRPITTEALKLISEGAVSAVSGTLTSSASDTADIGHTHHKEAGKTNRYAMSANVSSECPRGSSGQNSDDDFPDLPEFLRRSPR
jgi:AAA domain